MDTTAANLAQSQIGVAAVTWAQLGVVVGEHSLIATLVVEGPDLAHAGQDIGLLAILLAVHDPAIVLPRC